jgi:threonine dehydratase
MIGLEEIEAVRDRIASSIRSTPLMTSPSLSKLFGAPVHLKLEHHQATGSFKLRGAFNAVLQLTDGERARSMCGELLDDIILLSEAEIEAGIRHAYQQEREVVEGAGAVGIAALLANKVSRQQGPIVIVLSGRNIDVQLHRRIILNETGPQ